MKNILTALFICLSFTITAQTNLLTESAIKEYTANIDADQTLTKVVCSHNEFKNAITDGLETLYAYYQDGELVKIKHYQNVSPATEIFYIIHLQNNQIVSYRYVVQSKEYNQTTESFGTEWIIDKQIRLFYANKKIIELTTRGNNEISMKSLNEQVNNKIQEYKNMLRKK
jgi:hypothetical protein